MDLEGLGITFIVVIFGGLLFLLGYAVGINSYYEFGYEPICVANEWKLMNLDTNEYETVIIDGQTYLCEETN